MAAQPEACAKKKAFGRKAAVVKPKAKAKSKK